MMKNNPPETDKAVILQLFKACFYKVASFCNHVKAVGKKDES